MEICENCGRTIGKLETPHIHGEHVVCAECKQRLSDATPNSTAPPPIPYASPVTPASTPASDVDVWKSLRWLGFAMFVVGIFVHGVIALIGLVLWLVAGVVWLSKKK